MGRQLGELKNCVMRIRILKTIEPLRCDYIHLILLGNFYLLPQSHEVFKAWFETTRWHMKLPYVSDKIKIDNKSWYHGPSERYQSQPHKTDVLITKQNNPDN